MILKSRLLRLLNQSLLILIYSFFISSADCQITRNGKDKALIIAVKDYDHWNGLKNPLNDAKAIAKELENRFQFQVEILENPNKTEILDKLAAYHKETYATDEQLFVYFTGHGYFFDLGKEGFFITREGENKLQDPYGESWLSMQKIHNILAQLPSHHVLVIIDACYSGAFSRPLAIDKGEGPDSIFLAENFQYKSRLFISSGGIEPTLDGQGNHSPLTNALLHQMRTDKDGLVTFADLVAGIEFVKPKPRYGEFEGQEPGGNFYLVSKNFRVPQNNNTKFTRPKSNETPTEDFPYFQVGALKWMTKNLNVPVEGSICYDNNEDLCSSYGRLYTWKAANSACASIGWRLPADEEWQILTDLEETENVLKFNQLIASNSFNVQWGGWAYGAVSKTYRSLGAKAFYWTSNGIGISDAYRYSFNQNEKEIKRGRNSKTSYLSCRCVKN